MVKRIRSIGAGVLAVCMCFAAMPFFAFADADGNAVPDVSECCSGLSEEELAELAEDDPMYKGYMSRTAEEEYVDSDVAALSVVAQEEIYAYGMDVSAYQGNIDWYRVGQSGVSFVIIRIGYRGYGTGELRLDSYAVQNIEGALANGLDVGCYFFSTSVSEEEAREEAQFVIDVIKDYDITYPIAYDHEGYEDPDYRNYDIGDGSNDRRTAMSIAYLDYLEDHGYQGMQYGSTSRLSNNYRWNTTTLESKYQMWVANYRKLSDGTQYKNYQQCIDDGWRVPYSGPFRFWQFTSQGQVDGIAYDVDLIFEYCTTGETESGKTGNAVSVPSSDSTYTEYTTTGNVNYRTGPGTSYERAGTLETGTTVLVEDDYIAVYDGYAWYRVLIDGESYYMAAAYLEGPEEEEETTTYTTYTTTAAVNYRTGPGTSYKKAGTLAAGTEVQVEDHYYQRANGYIWYRVVIDGETYYMASEFLTATPDGSAASGSGSSVREDEQAEAKADIIHTDYNGVTGWWYVIGDEVQPDYTGLAQNSYGWWYIEDGTCYFNYTGLVQNEYGWWYIEDSHCNFNWTGLTQNEYGWWYIEDSHCNFNWTGLTQNEYGWWYIEDSHCNFNYTGPVQNEYGWWYIEDSHCNFDFNGTSGGHTFVNSYEV